MRFPATLAGLILLAGCGPERPVRTTDAGIALANLEATIDARERALAAGDARVAPELIALCLLRGQFLSRVSDYERAQRLADKWVARGPSAEAYLSRARARSALHRFEPALADLALAAGHGGDPDAIDGVRAAALQALGRFEEALRIRRRLVRLRADVTAIGAEAAVLADEGRAEEAAPRFRDAREAYRDASPFTLAWLEFQEGRMWMRRGDLRRARTLLASAHERLPAYVAAASHLGEVEAALGRTDRAIALLSAAAEDAEDPDPAAHLARVLAEAGRPQEAARWRDRAAAAYADLVARHPEAFSGHAAEFWLGAGGQPLELLARSAVVRSRSRGDCLVE